MKTGQMLFVAVGGMMLGAAGTLALQTGLVHHEVTLDIRPRGSVTVPPPALNSTAATDPYIAPPTAQSWEPSPPGENLPIQMPPLDEQQIAEIVSVREQIGSRAALNGLIQSDEICAEQFTEHLRAAAGVGTPVKMQPDEVQCPTCPSLPLEESSVARGFRSAQQR